MTNEQALILSILKNHINEQATTVPDVVDWRAVNEFAQNHQLQGIVYFQCKDYFKEHTNFSSFGSELRSAYLQSIYFTKTRERALNQVKDKFRQAGVNFFIIKGELIAQFYPHPAFRTMGDTDIVVDDRKKAHEILLSIGFENLSHFSDREWIYCNKGIEIELHNRLVYEEAINEEVITQFLNSYDDYITDGELDSSFHFIFVLCHLRKHFMNSGVGLRQFLDLAVLIKNDRSLRWDWIEEQLREINTLEFAKTVFSFIQRWVGVVAPIEGLELEGSVFEDSTTYIFNNGVFGFSNAENRDFLSSNKVRNSRFKTISMMHNAVRSVFPSYKSLCTSDKYSYLRGKPILLPVAWIRRFTNVIKNKRMNKCKMVIRNSFVSKEYITRREQLFRQWGLLN